MKASRLFVLSCLVWLCAATSALAEGFALTEWSSRGLGLAGGLVGRADDPSAIAYNAAGITQLPGTRLMGGFAAIAPMGTIQAYQKGQSQHTQTKPNIWPAPHGYVTHQLNDRLWLGLGVFSRFGLGNEYDSGWMGRYNVTDVNLQTVSAVPTVAFKVSDVLSLSAGVEIMYGMFGMGSQIPTYSLAMQPQADNEMNLKASGWGFGAQFGAHLKMTDEWSLGLTYKSKVALKLLGDASFDRQTDNMLAMIGKVPHAVDTDAHGAVLLPDSVSLGLSYKPLDNLSFEVGTVWTRWSDFKSLDIYFDSGYDAISRKNWRDGWNFNASVEYSPLDWLTLRGGVWYETPVVDATYADFMIPTNGRTVMTLGAGFKWENWTLDLAYAHLWINSLDYGSTRAAGIQGMPAYISGGESRDTVANIYSATIGYTF